MFSAAGSSTPSALFRQIRRSPLLFRKDSVIPFRLSASTLFRIRWEKLLGVSPSAPAGSIFSNSTLAGALISGCRRSSSERKKESVRWAVLPVRSHLTAVSRYDPCHRTPASAPDRGCPVRRSRAWLCSPSFFLLRRKPLFRRNASVLIWRNCKAGGKPTELCGQSHNGCHASDSACLHDDCFFHWNLFGKEKEIFFVAEMITSNRRGGMMISNASLTFLARFTVILRMGISPQLLIFRIFTFSAVPEWRSQPGRRTSWPAGTAQAPPRPAAPCPTGGWTGWSCPRRRPPAGPTAGSAAPE